MDRPWIRKIFYGAGRIRPIWRILVFFALFAAFSAAGQYAVSVLPRQPLNWVGLVVVTLAALLAGWIPLTRLDRRPAGALGLPWQRGAVRQIATGLLTGLVFNGVAVLLLLVSGSAHFTADSGTAADYLLFITWTLFFFGAAAALEEALFRGYPFQVLVEWIGVWPATIVAAVLFSLLHANNPNVTPFALANIFLAGVMLSVAYLRTMSLWFVTALHLGWNWMMASLLDFPVSGLEFDTPLYEGVPTGFQWWTGGPFGPEAGVAATIVVVLGTVWLVRSRLVKPDPQLVALRPLPLHRLEKARWV